MDAEESVAVNSRCRINVKSIFTTLYVDVVHEI